MGTPMSSMGESSNYPYQILIKMYLYQNYQNVSIKMKWKVYNPLIVFLRHRGTGHPQIIQIMTISCMAVS